MSRALLHCHACRNHLIDAFLIGISTPAQPSRNLNLSSQRLKNQRRRYNLTPAFRRSSTESSAPAPQDLPEDASPVPPPSTSNGTTDSTPWYLSIPTPQPPAPISPLLALQEIPPLPSNPPSILSPLLTHLSDSIGLDNITLLDLRHLNPPSALGANLLMIIGTARSVKHLNVSADRFCRWLRTEYKLRPYADGLLGRNELKLKLRRKARRQKMMGLVGAGGRMESADDGITTGWVCVNVGAVNENIVPRSKEERALDDIEGKAEEAAGSLSDFRSPGVSDLEEEEYQNPGLSFSENEADTDEDDSYVGFGSSNTAPRIVVQMFTEEKRLEMDLEGLWEHRNTKREAKEERRDGEAEERVLAKGMGEFKGRVEMNAVWERERKREQGRGERVVKEDKATAMGKERENVKMVRDRLASEDSGDTAAGTGRGKERASIFGD